jgi:HAD superfamily hydrolase (TIGR01509 family)
MIKGIIFDFDGVILDTETIDYHIVNEIYMENGVMLPLDLWQQRIGGDKNNFDPYDYLINCTTNNLDKIELKKYKKLKYQQRIVNEELLPGVLSLLEETKKKKIRVGLASSSPRERIVDLLIKFNILEYFSCIVTAEDVDKVKPYPDLYLNTLELMKVDPQYVIAIEDSPTGAIAAKNAGLFCVIVPNEVTKRLTFQEVDLRLNSLKEMNLSKISKYKSTRKN